MTRFEVTVEMPVQVDFIIDDEKTSDWDGTSLMTAHQAGERWNGGGPVGLNTSLAAMAIAIIDRGRVGGTDGWADFPEDATEQGWPYFDTSHARIQVRRIESDD